LRETVQTTTTTTPPPPPTTTTAPLPIIAIFTFPADNADGEDFDVDNQLLQLVTARLARVHCHLDDVVVLLAVVERLCIAQYS